MKQLICTGVLVMSGLWGAHAQGLRVGLRTGANYSAATGADTRQLEGLWGPAGGASSECAPYHGWLFLAAAGDSLCAQRL